MAYIKTWISLVGAILIATPRAKATPVADIDVGAPQEAAVFGFGWWRAEQNAERSFRWIRFHLEADTWITLLDDPGPTEIELIAAPYYHPRHQQRVALYINDRFVAEWTFPHNETWRFDALRAPIPAGVFRPGRNRLILRTGYVGHRGYAVAVDRITIRREPHRPNRLPP